MLSSKYDLDLGVHTMSQRLVVSMNDCNATPR